MKGKFLNGFKFRWNRYKKKKGFFPALYIGLAAIILTVVFFSQKEESSTVDEDFAKDEIFSNDNERFDNEEAKEVLQEEEMIQLPMDPRVKGKTVTKFFDANGAEDELEQSVTFYNNRYYESKGVHLKAEDDTAFDVVAAISGKVKEIKEDPLLGNIVILEHDNGIETYYASLAETSVEENAEVKQGEKLGEAGKNVFHADSGIHVHFDIHKDVIEVNTESFIDETLQNLVELSLESPDEEKEVEENDEMESEVEEEEEEEDSLMENEEENEESLENNDDLISLA